MLNIVASLVGSLEYATMECFWTHGPQTSGDILATLRAQGRTIAHSTVTTTLARLAEQGMLTRVRVGGSVEIPFWRYTARYASRGALLAGVFEQLAAQLEADHPDRAEALGALLGIVR
jgi:predicted transcriptional regulator